MRLGSILVYRATSVITAGSPFGFAQVSILAAERKHRGLWERFCCQGQHSGHHDVSVSERIANAFSLIHFQIASKSTSLRIKMHQCEEGIKDQSTLRLRNLKTQLYFYGQAYRPQ